LFDESLERWRVPERGQVTTTHGGRMITYRADRSGAVRVLEEVGVTHAAAVERARRSGFRLCTSDEWEYACGAGTRTLFRWGDRFPSIDYEWEPDPWERVPDVELLSDPDLMKQYVAHLQNDPRRQPPGNPSVGPNAFGLVMPNDFDQNPEYCAEADVLRGICGPNLLHRFYPPHVGWLPTAPSYHNPWPIEWTQLALGPVAIRRAISLRGGP
jgi:hypothetical protein